MTREEKSKAISELTEKFSKSQFFYITDASTLTVEKVNNLRRLCFDKGIEMKVVKNALAKKALQSIEKNGEYAPIYSALEGPSAIMFSDSAKAPAHLIEAFRKTNSRPILKAAYIDSDVYSGDEQIAILVKLKSKEDLIGEIIMILQSPLKNVISGLKSSGSTIAGLVKTLQERAN